MTPEKHTIHQQKPDEDKINSLSKLAGDVLRSNEMSGCMPILLRPINDIIAEFKSGNITHTEAETKLKELNENTGDRD
jgi:hypothetical protein